MGTIILFSLFFLMMLILIIGINGTIVVGTINKKTIEEKAKLEDFGYKIFHADQLRDQGFNYEKAGKKIFIDFLINIFLFKKSALFTSNPKLLILKSFIAEDCRVTKSENLAWAEELPPLAALEYLPKYFSKDSSEEKYEQAAKRVDVFMKELEGYPKDRFLPESFNGIYFAGKQAGSC